MNMNRPTLNLDCSPIINTRKDTLEDITKRCRGFILQAARTDVPVSKSSDRIVYSQSNKSSEPVPSFSINSKAVGPHMDIGRTVKDAVKIPIAGPEIGKNTTSSGAIENATVDSSATVPDTTVTNDDSAVTTK
eukprot:scaffold16499_cov60-Attheya_sp.AAC.1